MAYALTASSYKEIRDDRVTAIIFSAEGTRVLTHSGLNYKDALEVVMSQNSIGRVVLMVPDDVPHHIGLIRDIDEAREAIKALGRLKFN